VGRIAPPAGQRRVGLVMEGRKPGHHPDGHNCGHDIAISAIDNVNLANRLIIATCDAAREASGGADTVTLQLTAVRVTHHCHVGLHSLLDRENGGLRAGSQIPVQRGMPLRSEYGVEAAMELKLVLNPAHALP